MVTFLMTLSDPKPPHFAFCTTFHFSVTGVDRDFKFGTYVDYSKSHQASDKSSSLKGAWSWSRDALEFYTS